MRANPHGFIQDLSHHGDIFDRALGYQAQNGDMLVLFDGAELIGMGALRPAGDGSVELCHLHLNPAYHGKGLGRYMAETLIDRAKYLTYKTVKLHVTVTQSAATTLYQRLGFKPTHREVYQTRDQVFDTVFMELPLTSRED